MTMLQQDFLGEQNAMDDSFTFADTQKTKVNYFNILVIGAQKTGKFNFIKFLFEHCFKKKFDIDQDHKTFREFVYRVQNGRRGTRVLNIIHSKGYSEEYSMIQWYQNIKSFLKERI